MRQERLSTSDSQSFWEKDSFIFSNLDVVSSTVPCGAASDGFSLLHTLYRQRDKPNQRLSSKGPLQEVA
ncbi:hypothetical protein [Paraburkholderia sp. XV]|uniref:hypothetical protein n=1 Tax=Paraburkholderia sp. XV TaxID=2831520 RepID=UPI001CD811A9|nr:hypothetical protein [Paraburkholderia sp. XV]